MGDFVLEKESRDNNENYLCFFMSISHCKSSDYDLMEHFFKKSLKNLK